MSKTEPEGKISGMADFFVEGLPRLEVHASSEPKYVVLDVGRKLKLYFDSPQHLRAFVGKIIEVMPK